MGDSAETPDYLPVAEPNQMIHNGSSSDAERPGDQGLSMGTNLGLVPPDSEVKPVSSVTSPPLKTQMPPILHDIRK